MTDWRLFPGFHCQGLAPGSSMAFIASMTITGRESEVKRQKASPCSVPPQYLAVLFHHSTWVLQCNIRTPIKCLLSACVLSAQHSALHIVSPKRSVPSQLGRSCHDSSFLRFTTAWHAGVQALERPWWACAQFPGQSMKIDILTAPLETLIPDLCNGRACDSSFEMLLGRYWYAAKPGLPGLAGPLMNRKRYQTH